MLELTLVDQGPFPTREAALQAYGNTLPGDLEILPGQTEGGAALPACRRVFYVVKRVPAVSGSDLRSAQQSLDEFNRPAVDFTLKQDAATRFGTFTEQNIDKPLAIVLDNRVMSAPRSSSRITDNGQITGITPRGDERPGHHPEVGRAAGDDDLSRGADGRCRRSARTRSAPACWPRSVASRWSSSSCSSTTS